MKGVFDVHRIFALGKRNLHRQVQRVSKTMDRRRRDEWLFFPSQPFWIQMLELSFAPGTGKNPTDRAETNLFRVNP